MTRRYVETEEYAAFARRVLAAYRRRVAGDHATAPDIDNLAGLAALADEIDAAILDAVTGLRAHGDYSWAAIGDALGVTRQAAQQRYGADGLVARRLAS